VISYLENKEIDYAKWDFCLSESSNRLVYANSWYLDLVCDDWDALVLNDYEAVMPLPKRKKWGIQYVYQPFFCQQLGIFSNQSGLDVDVFLEAIPKHFKYVELNISQDLNSKSFTIKKNINQELDLNCSTGERRINYSNSHLKNRKKGEKYGLECVEDVKVLGFLEDKKRLANNHMTSFQFGLQKKIMTKSIQMGFGHIFSAVKNEKVYASCFLLKESNRLTLLSDYCIPKGRKVGAYFYLLDAVFSKFEKMDICFDFEGSNLGGVAKRNEGFGAREVMYQTVKINRLPFFLRWLKS
jgi:hypothetical protein